MSLDRETHSDGLLGLGETFPRPGWVVLDAVREHRFTGEVILDTVPEVRVYADRGHIYIAERTTDPSLGSRLVDAGALNAAQLEHGSIRLGGSEHLGRLFERVPSVDRHSVLVISDLMTEECVGWLAGQMVAGARAVPYRHHPSGMHRWELTRHGHDLVPGDPLPAPASDDPPVPMAPPEPLFGDADSMRAEPMGDDMIQWDEVSWLDERLPSDTSSPSPVTADTTEPPVAGSRVEEPVEHSRDWIDRLDAEGLPTGPTDPLEHAASLPPVTVDRVDRFEVIWPSGEIDEQFGAIDDVSGTGRDRELDRVGPTARIARDASALPERSDHPAESAVVEGAGEPVDDVTDEVVLAVRRAVASIDTGSLAARRRLATSPAGDDTSRGHGVVPPGRVAVRDEPSVWSPGGAADAGGSVFDDPADAAPVLPVDDQPDTEAAPPVSRESALRRLIGSLRRH